MVLKLLAVATLVVSGLLAYSNAPKWTPVFPEIGPRPIVALPSTEEVNGGDGFYLTVGMDKVATVNTTVTLSSSNTNAVTVPGSVVVLAGHDSAMCAVSTSATTPGASKDSTYVTITATANGGSAYGGVTVN